MSLRWGVVFLVACGSSDPTDTQGTSTETSTTSTVEVGHEITGFSSVENPDFPLYQQFEIAVSPTAMVEVICTDQDDSEDVHVLTSEAAADTHVLELYGLRGLRSYDCVATAEDAVANLVFSTEPLPFNELPALDLTVEHLGDHGEGYVLYNHFPSASASREAVVFVDTDGDVRWYHKVDDTTLASLDVSYAGDDVVLLGGGGGTQTTGVGNGLPPTLVGLDGVEQWRGPRSPNGQPHHHASMLPNGDVLWLDQVDMVDGASDWMGFYVRQMTPFGVDFTFDWTSQTAFDRGHLPKGPVDPYHANSVLYVDDIDGPAYYVSLKRSHSIVRLDQTTGDITWELGHGGDFTLFGEDGTELTEPEDWFSGQHDPELNGNRLLIHDNRDRSFGQLTRVLELELDIPSRTAAIVWQWREDDWHEALFGDADLLPNGNVQISQGRENGADTTLRQSRIIEVDPVTDQVVWRMQLGEGISVYQAERVDGCEVFSNRKFCSDL